MTDVVRLERLTLVRRATAVCTDVSLSVPPGAVYALLGRKGAGKSPLVDCILGREKPAAGRALVFGEEPWRWRWRRRLARRIARSPEELGGDRELLVLDDPPEAPAIPGAGTSFLTASVPESVEGVATHVGILKRGRLVLDGAVADLERGLRRIRYVNRMTETRSAFGTELDDFDAVRVQVRGWGIDAVVSNFDPEAFARFRTLDGVEDARAEALSLAEAFEALG